MKTTAALILAVAVALIGVPSLASAVERPSNYIEFMGGLYAPSKDFDIEGNDFKLDDGFVAQIAFGHYFLPMLALELGGGYFESKASPARPAGEPKFQVVPLTATGKVLFPIGPIVEPYGLFGIGAYVTKAEVSGDVGNFEGSTETAFGYHAGGGVNVNLGPVVFVGAEGRYIWVKPSFGGDDIKLDGFTVTANLGLRF
jgi:opacity protein-like surface antigen